ncbi:hypothetical protein [Paenibacillus cremeus]|uniref:Uncharacterized protein n=1 Tax=Paenibacillus cremeus TaxID=2163881 RepID=A0A559JK94_9BACL|nr:hypothetical protein [Paenibacillus cremeus]TVY00274.1 hypothetical protein FPZ49_33350 [Paenibacillus cremeus]
MEQEEIRRLELKFGRKLSEGEAAEIANVDIIADEDDQLYAEADKVWSTLAIGDLMRKNQ